MFGDKATGGYLLKFSWFNIERHALVQGTASPDDPGLREYWANREKPTQKLYHPGRKGWPESRTASAGYVIPRCSIGRHYTFTILNQGGRNEGTRMRTARSYTASAINRYTGANAPKRRMHRESNCCGAARSLLEPGAVKVARTVLQGLGDGDIPRLSDRTI